MFQLREVEKLISKKWCRIHCRCQSSVLDVLQRCSQELEAVDKLLAADSNFEVADNCFEVDNSLIELVDRNFVALPSLELGSEIDRIEF